MLRIPALPLPIYFCENNDNNNMSCVKHNKCRGGSKPSWKFPSCFRAGQGSLQREEGQLGVITRVFQFRLKKQFRFYLPMFFWLAHNSVFINKDKLIQHHHVHSQRLQRQTVVIWFVSCLVIIVHTSKKFCPYVMVNNRQKTIVQECKNNQWFTGPTCSINVFKAQREFNELDAFSTELQQYRKLRKTQHCCTIGQKCVFFFQPYFCHNIQKWK